MTSSANTVLIIILIVIGFILAMNYAAYHDTVSCIRETLIANRLNDTLSRLPDSIIRCYDENGIDFVDGARKVF